MSRYYYIPAKQFAYAEIFAYLCVALTKGTGEMLKALFFLYQWLIAGPILLVLTAITAIVTSVGSIMGDRDFWGYWPPRIWSRAICTLWFVKVKVEGRELLDSRKGYVFVANHQGAFDIWAIYGYLGHNFKWLMKKGLEKIFLVGAACRRAGHIMVDDSNLHAVKETMSQAEKILSNGMSLVIFPEGSRSWDGKLIPFKRGAFMLAAEFGMPVVPITINGSFHAMPRTTYNVTPGTITLTIHQPIEPGHKGFNTKQLMEQCRSAIAAALPGEEGNHE